MIIKIASWYMRDNLVQYILLFSEYNTYWYKGVLVMEKYTRAQIVITEFETEDVITSSSIVPGEDDMEILPNYLEDYE